METLLPLVAFSLVSSVTPGPNNVLLWASGASFGVRASLAHVLGTALGIGLMALVAAAGVGAVLAVLPGLGLGLRLVSSLYLLVLAWQVAGSRALARGRLAHPLGLVQAAAFQVVNPKAWVFAVGAMTTFRPQALAPVQGSLLAAATMALVVVPTAALWAGAGGAMGRLLADERHGPRFAGALAVLLAASVAAVWL